jgi:TfoX/Sxy family transcriptional regulator of competence genes
MAHDEALADRVRDVLARRRGIREKKMFGGLSFLTRGNMFCGVTGDDLMVRVGPEAHRGALAQPHARPMDFTGKPMKGYVFVAPAAFASAPELLAWVERGLDYGKTLPPK